MKSRSCRFGVEALEDRCLMSTVIYGDFKTSDMQRLVARTFGDWKKDPSPSPALPPLPPRAGDRVVFAPKDDVTQSAVVLAHLGFKADSPDYADMEVLERALGGGFQSRLFNHIRTQRGLAYSTGANEVAGRHTLGHFDLPLRNCTVALDGKTIVDSGRLLPPLA